MGIYNRGRPADKAWVFGMCDTSMTPALGYMELVDHRDAATLLPIILAHVQPGTTIWSDGWAAYNSLATTPAISGYSTVNHSVEFVSPTGVHTNHNERLPSLHAAFLS